MKSETFFKGELASQPVDNKDLTLLLEKKLYSFTKYQHNCD